MELALFVWFAQIVGDISTLLFLTAILTGILGLLRIAFTVEEGPSDVLLVPEVYRKGLKRLFYICLASTLLYTVLPKNEKQFYWIAGAYMAQQAVTSDFGKRLLSVIEKKTLEYIEDLEKGEKK